MSAECSWTTLDAGETAEELFVLALRLTEVVGLEAELILVLVVVLASSFNEEVGVLSDI